MDEEDFPPLPVKKNMMINEVSIALDYRSVKLESLSISHWDTGQQHSQLVSTLKTRGGIQFDKIAEQLLLQETFSVREKIN